MADFKGRHFEGEVVLWAVRWYCRYGVSYRDLERMMGERGVSVDHSTIYRGSVTRTVARFSSAGRMAMTISFARHQFPPEMIRHAVWLYVRFTLSYRDVEDLLAERGLDVSYETVRRWVLKFGPLFARELRRRRPRPTSRWHLDEMAVMIAGRQFWLWRAVDDEGEVLDLLVQRRRDKAAAVKLMRKLLKKEGFAPVFW